MATATKTTRENETLINKLVHVYLNNCRDMNTPAATYATGHIHDVIDGDVFVIKTSIVIENGKYRREENEYFLTEGCFEILN